MPKGVEHIVFVDGFLHTLSPPTSVMPKGVEHGQHVQITLGDFIPPTSVMPKGVEHPVSPSAIWLESRTAHLCDAERR